MSKILHRTKRGFTLVELLIVIIIIAVLAAVAIPKFANSSQRGKESALRAELKIMRNAIELFKNDTGAYPDVLETLALPAGTASIPNGYNPDGSGGTKTIAAADYKGPYIDTISKDPTSGAAFAYTKETGKVASSTSGYTSW